MMNNDIVNILLRETDLDSTAEFWEGDSCERRMYSIKNFIERNTGYLPSKNMRPLREVVFTVEETTTIDDLLHLGKKIKKRYSIDLFQCSIDRVANTAHLLFDWYDRKRKKCVYLNHRQRIFFSVYIVHILGLSRSSEQWLFYYLSCEYMDNPKVFSSIKSQLKRAKLGKRSYQILCDSLTYIQQKCQGFVK